MRFKPSWKLTLALFAICYLFAWLGFWQLDREIQKKELFDDFENAPVMSIEQALKQPGGFTRAEAYGKFDPDRHILLDNKIFEGRVGVHVISPFYLDSGGTLLVNRGWLPLQPDRRKLPSITTPTEKRIISGLMKQPLSDGQRLGDADVLSDQNWPQLVTYFDLDAVSEALQSALPPWLLQLDLEDSAGFGDRQWQAAVMTPQVHRAYALQWFSLALATIIIWVTLGVRRGQQTNKQQD